MLSVKSDNSTQVPSVQEYFPKINGDLTKVEWAHAVNSQKLLKQALENSKVMMLEADVVLGTLYNDSNIMPIMAHPPKNESDLSLNMFLEAAVNVQSKVRKGVKLDFKSTESFEASFKILEFFNEKFTFPVFLNADILSGPINSKTKPVDSGIFLMLSSKVFSKTTLSLGWTTNYGAGNLGSYTEEQLNEMLTLLKKQKVVQPVTLCVRAGIAAETKGIKSLLKSIDQYQNNNKTTVTIWMSNDSDPVNIAKLKELIFDLTKERVFLDVPDFIRNKLFSVSTSNEQEFSKSPITAAQGAVVALLTSISTIFSNVF